MGPDSVRLDELLTVARKHGVIQFKYQGLEVTLVPPSIATDRNVVIGDEDQMPSEDQLLYWSSGLAPDLQAEPPLEA